MQGCGRGPPGPHYTRSYLRRDDSRGHQEECKGQIYLHNAPVRKYPIHSLTVSSQARLVGRRNGIHNFGCYSECILFFADADGEAQVQGQEATAGKQLVLRQYSRTACGSGAKISAH